MGRSVNVELPDGSIQRVDNVPDNIKDAQVENRFGGKVIPMSTAEDIGRSAASGVPFGVSRTLSAIPKAMIGFDAMLGLSPTERLRQGVREVQQIERVGDQLGGGYSPMTKAGQYAKSATASAVPIPGMGPPFIQAGLGALSGVMAQGAGDLGMGQVGQTVAATLPYAGAALKSAVQPRHPAMRTREALEQLSPDEQVAMRENLRLARENDVNIAAWQAAPEGSEFRNLGRAVASSPASGSIRSKIGEQSRNLVGDPNMYPPQGPMTSRVSSPMYKESGKVPLSPDQAAAIQENILNVKRTMGLAPDSPRGRMVDAVAEQFGKWVEVPPVETISKLDAIGKALPQGDPRRAAIQKEIIGYMTGKIPPERVFQTDIKSFAELQDIYKVPKLPKDMSSIDSDTATKLAIRDAIAEYADKFNPKFPRAREKHADLKTLETIVKDTDPRSRAQALEASSATRTELVPELLYAGATTPAWASIPLVRELGKRQMMRQYNRVFGSADPSDYLALAAQRPLTTSLKYTGLGLLSPFRQGEFQLEE